MKIRLVLVTGAVVTGLLAAVSPARADGTDDSFLTKLESQGINDTVSPSHVIDAGHFVCVKLDNGSSPGEVMKDVQQSSGLPAEDSGFFVGASIDAYCPRHTNEIPAG